MADEIAFTVLDIFEGFTRLTKRTPTLDGSVPLRVAQGCVPLLQGNAYGFQVSLTREFTVQTGLAGPRIRGDLAHLERLRHANVPRLHESGLLDRQGPFASLATRVAWTSGRSRIHLFTGLLLKPEPDVALRVTHAANRRNTSIEIDESWIPFGQGFVPLILSIDVRRSARLVGEVACVGPLRAGVTVEGRPLREAPEAARSHVAFYDQQYFDTKKRGVSRKYRRHVADDGHGVAARTARCEVIEAGPVKWDVVSAGPFVGRKRGEPGPTIESAVFVSPFAFTATFDGQTMSIEAAPVEISRAAALVEKTFNDAMDPAFVAANRGALWYLTKFFTPHPPGDPHFFVKPWAFTRTPPGWSSLLDGVNGPGFDILRGVVSTDSFHATPAVFRLLGEGHRISVRKGQPLLRVIPVPRRLLEAGFATETLPEI